MSSFTLYWILMLDSICNVFFLFSILIGISLIMIGILWLVELDSGYPNEEEIIKIKKLFKRIFISFIVFVLFSVFLPTTKQVAVIYLVPKIVNNERVQNVADNSLTMLQKLTEEWIQEYAPKTMEKE